MMNTRIKNWIFFFFKPNTEIEAQSIETTHLPLEISQSRLFTYLFSYTIKVKLHHKDCKGI